MPSSHHVHLLDGSSSRRARLARALGAHGIHAEIYETVAELRGTADRPAYPKQGAVLVSDDDQIDLSAVLADMREAGCFLPVVAFTASGPLARRIVAALRAGAVDYLCFPEDMTIAGRSIAGVIEQAARLAKRYEITALARTRVARLSKQERRVLESVIRGARSKETAIEMGLSSRTIEVHRAAVLQKLEVATSAGAIAMGIAAGMMTTLGETAATDPADDCGDIAERRAIGWGDVTAPRLHQLFPAAVAAELYRKAG
ncbi:LuxR C-terminal-related transcriptional regulator [Tsuneonella sp. YG55]|uniref:LuxR C-terminal-related transcriptional regulator n=1 Tax=Tsuneonella litorea TaxID=2976475 RepID=A0A9X2W2H7_9SPHN|nr:LuxR C-terminal-related transcriptional regulator [Tsuneonella litorea]MCT2559044.1 LuxR C-terminal-related transcriptional regulator [Tsuneonella litorea]